MNAMALSPSISVNDLRVPGKAQRELEKASKQIEQKNFTKALRTVQQALETYPEYASAYNNLGVIYARLGDRDREREALEKAISLNDHLAPAYANLGRMSINSGDFPAAEAALKKASACDPLDGITLLLLAYSQFMQKNMDAAIETSRQAHALKSTHAFVHQIAARAFEQKRDATNAISELQLFIKEEPSGPRADSARKELELVQAVPR
jgi:Flp pilus assembly protein TadD